MSDWQEVHLSALGEIFDGPHATPSRVESGPYFLNIASLSRGRLDLAKSDHVSPSDFDRWTRRVTPQEGDLLFSYETRLGEAALMPPNVEACLGRRMALIRPNRSVVNPQFLLYLYLSPTVQTLIEKETIHGATVNRIALSTMGNWSLQMPPLAIQSAIGEMLGALDAKLAVNEDLSLSIEARLSLEVKAMWLDKSSNLRVPLHSIVDLNPQTPRPTEAEPVYIDMKKLPESGSGIAAAENREAKGGTRFMQGDTLMARITPCLENRKTGFVDSLAPDQVGIGSTEFIAIRTREPYAKPLSYFLAVNEEFRDFAIRHMAGTSGRQRVSASVLATYEIPKPDESWLLDFGARATLQFEYLKSLRAQNTTLAALRDTLLPPLMSGKLRVRDAERTVSEVL